MMIENDKEKSLNDATPPEVQNDIRSESTEKSKEMGLFSPFSLIFQIIVWRFEEYSLSLQKFLKK